MILVDSSKYITWMRAGRNPSALLAPVVQAGELVSCGIVRIEVLRGIVNPKVETELTSFFDIVPEVALTPALFQEAARLAWTLDRQGRLLPVTDLIIATCAKRAGAVLISEDPHFQHVPALTVRSDL